MLPSRSTRASTCVPVAEAELASVGTARLAQRDTSTAIVVMILYKAQLVSRSLSLYSIQHSSENTNPAIQ